MRQANFWQWYSEVNDDIRRQVVERGWFGRELTGSTQESFYQGEQSSAYDAPQLASGPISEFYGSSRAEETEAADLYGTATWSAEPSSSEHEQDAPEPTLYEIEPEQER